MSDFKFGLPKIVGGPIGIEEFRVAVWEHFKLEVMFSTVPSI
jgi:hypothetical protein